jgi:hypothetical protein
MRKTPTQEEIARRAYELWEKDGRPEGREREHWSRAERELANARAAAPSNRSGGAASGTPGSAAGKMSAA